MRKRRVKVRKHKRRLKSGGTTIVKKHSRKLKQSEDIWEISPHYPMKKHRKMEKIKTPKFKSPVEKYDYMWSNSKCTANCQAIYLPRNAILIRIEDQELKNIFGEEIYLLFERIWKSKIYRKYAHGSVYETISIGRLKHLLRKEVDPRILDKIKISTLDNIDNSSLKKNDLLLSRVGSKRSVGKPFLIQQDYEDT